MGVILTRQRCPIPLQSGRTAFWWDASDPNGDGTIPTYGSAQAMLVDKSGNKLTASQPAAGNQATFFSDVQNGLPGLYFMHDMQNYYDTAPLDLTNSFTLYVTINSQSINTYSVFDIAVVDLPEFGFTTGANQYGGGNYDGFVNNGFAWADADSYVPHIMCFRYDADSGFAQMFIDNVAYTPVPNSNVSAAGLIARRLGGHPVAGVFYEGWMHEIFGNYGSDSDDLVTRNLRYMGNKWGILKP